jgi:YVTN family beta-propeller protein
MDNQITIKMRTIEARTPAFCSLICALLMLMQSGCEEFQGLTPPTDVLYYPVEMALHPNGGYLYVVNTNFDVTYAHESGGMLTIIDTETLEILSEKTVSLGSFGGEIALSEDARYLYIAVRGDNSLVRLDVSESGDTVSCDGGLDGLPCRIMGLPSDPYALDISQWTVPLEAGEEAEVELIMISHLSSGEVTGVSIVNDDIASAHVVSVDTIVGGSAFARHPRTGLIYVTARFDGRVRALYPDFDGAGNIASIYPLSTMTLSNPVTVYDTRDILFTADGDEVYVATQVPNTLMVFDTSSSDIEDPTASWDTLVEQIDLTGSPQSMVFSDTDEAIYIAQINHDELVVLDPQTRTVIEEIYVGLSPADLVVDSTLHQRLYVSLFNEDAVAVVDVNPESRRYLTTVAKVR